MDLLKLGLRNLVGILLPGALVVLVLFYAVLSGAFSAGVQMRSAPWMEDRFLNLIALFVLVIC
jgi:hypothetical protein